jgi:hypothetical protein
VHARVECGDVVRNRCTSLGHRWAPQVRVKDQARARQVQTLRFLRPLIGSRHDEGSQIELRLSGRRPQSAESVLVSEGGQKLLSLTTMPGLP